MEKKELTLTEEMIIKAITASLTDEQILQLIHKLTDRVAESLAHAKSGYDYE